MHTGSRWISRHQDHDSLLRDDPEQAITAEERVVVEKEEQQFEQISQLTHNVTVAAAAQAPQVLQTRNVITVPSTSVAHHPQIQLVQAVATSANGGSAMAGLRGRLDALLNK